MDIKFASNEYIPNSATFTVLLWLLVSFYVILALLSVVQVIRPMNSLFKTHFHWILFFIIALSIGNSYKVRIIFLSLLKYLSFRAILMLQIIHCCFYILITSILVVILSDICIQINKAQNQLTIIGQSYSHFMTYMISITFILAIFIISLLGVENAMEVGAANKTLMYICFSYWISLMVVITPLVIALKKKTKEVYIFGFGDNVPGTIRRIYIALMIFAVFGIIFGNFINMLNKTHFPLFSRCILFFIRYLFVDMIPLFIVAFLITCSNEKSSLNRSMISFLNQLA